MTKSSTGRKKSLWSKNNIEKAIEDIRAQKIGWKRGAKIFEVPKTSLMRLLKENNCAPAKAAAVRAVRPNTSCLTSCARRTIG